MAKVHYDSMTLSGLHMLSTEFTHIVAFDPRLKSNKMQCMAAVNITKKLTKSEECKLAIFIVVLSNIYSSSIHIVYAVTDLYY